MSRHLECGPEGYQRLAESSSDEEDEEEEPDEEGEEQRESEREQNESATNAAVNQVALGEYRVCDIHDIDKLICHSFNPLFY